MRDLTEDDAALVGDLLARAFVEDPPIVWLFPDPADRVEGMREVFTANARLALAKGQVVLTDEGGATGLFLPAGVEVDAAAVEAAGLPASLDSTTSAAR